MNTLKDLITPSGKWTDVSAIIFDVFGTIAEITAPQHAYAELLKELKNVGYEPNKDKKWDILTKNMTFKEAIELFDVDKKLSSQVKEKLQLVLDSEVNSIELYDDVEPVFKFLIDREIGVALCSNLAQPFANKIIELLKDVRPDALVWSFEQNIAKPHPKMFLSACEKMGVEPKRVVMVGNSQKNDIDAANNAGIEAIKIVRSENGLKSSKKSYLKFR